MLGNQITYSFIIPHKNAPQLLDRCLNSIPRRTDVQIIVVDDASDEDIVDWNTFHFTDNRCVELVLTKEKRGAGFARNEGMKHAKGKWLLFSDADDTYVDGFLDILDKYKETDLEVLYFNYFESDSKGNKHPIRLISKNNQDVTDALKYKLKAPWYKMVSRVFINKFNIFFEETLNGNDVFYTLQVGFYSKNCKSIEDFLYIYWHNKYGLTNNKNNSDYYYLCQFKHRYQTNSFYNYIGQPTFKKSIISRLLSILKSKGIKPFFKAFNVYISHRNEIIKDRYLFVDYLKNNKKI